MKQLGCGSMNFLQQTRACRLWMYLNIQIKIIIRKTLMHDFICPFVTLSESEHFVCVRVQRSSSVTFATL